MTKHGTLTLILLNCLFRFSRTSFVEFVRASVAATRNLDADLSAAASPSSTVIVVTVVGRRSQDRDARVEEL